MIIKGQVKWFDPKKGYGFIIGPDGQDVFVHYTHINTDGFKLLRDSEWVDYDLVEGDKGWQARDVSRLTVHVDGQAAKESVENYRGNNSADPEGNSSAAPEVDE